MKKVFFPILCLWLAALGCQVIPTPPPLTPSPASPEGMTSFSTPANQATAPFAVQTPLNPQNTPAFTLSPIEPLLEAPFADTKLVTWQPNNLQNVWFDLPVDMDQIVNQEVLAGLTASQRRYLAQNGFLVLDSKDANFTAIRLNVSLEHGQPYFLTTDAASYALHSSVFSLLTALEREELSRRLTQVVLATLGELQANLAPLQGSILEKDAKLAVVYMAIGLSLLDPSIEISLPADLMAMVSNQLKQIYAADGVQQMSMLPGVSIDFSVFKIPLVYRGEPALETYYLGKTWFSQAGFSLKEKPGLPASRAPMIITMALQRANVDGTPAAQIWADLDATMAFFYGRSLDNDPRLYAAWMKQVYGDKISMLALADEGQWQVFLVMAETFPQESSYMALTAVSREQMEEREWRFLGRRSTPDRITLQALPVEREKILDLPHYTPSGLDWLAVLGGTKAEQLLDRYTVTSSGIYLEQMERLQAAYQTQGHSQWQSTVFNIGIFSFLAQELLEPTILPPFMRSEDWAQKEINSALGNWIALGQERAPSNFQKAELKETGIPASKPAPGYVEPNPEIFYRLSYLANVIVDGLANRNMSGIFAANQGDESLGFRLQELRDLADRFSRLGDIADKEIRGIPLDPSEYALIQAPLGYIDQNQIDLAKDSKSIQDEFIPLAAMIATPVKTEEWGLHTGTGWLDRLYVLVELDGEILVAQGGVYTYYEFNRPSQEMLNRAGWLWELTHAFPERPAWSTIYHLPGGVPYSVLAFRNGDVYRITAQGANLSMRIDANRVAKTVYRLKAGDYVQFLEGPVESDGATWWNVSLVNENSEPVQGWVIQNQGRFIRIW